MKNECWGIILAAGKGSRLGEATGGIAKQFLFYRGYPLWWHSVLAMANSPKIHGIVLVFPKDQTQEAETALEELCHTHSPGVRILTAVGGSRRQDSVRHGLSVLPPECSHVLIHDSARPFVSVSLISRLADALDTSEPSQIYGVIPGHPVTDTIKEVNLQDIVLRTPERSQLRAIQTPQAFSLEFLRQAHSQAEQEGWTVTDDASLMERCGYAVRVIEGERKNIKITHPQDLHLLKEQKTTLPCCGYGYDVHAYGGNRPLRLGGIEIGREFQIQAHSDGDVLLHALMDAILGCFGAGDIGRYFPDNDPQFSNISSVVLLDKVLSMASEAGVCLTHVDLTIIAQKPRISPYAERIQRNIARLLNLSSEHVNVKATTEEHLGFTGELKGIKAVALVTALR